MAEIIAELEAAYCPPIDPALLSAILSDYDLANSEEVESAKTTLDALKEDALLEEAAGFDASGTGARDGDTSNRENAESQIGTHSSHSKESDLTSVSNQLSSLDLEESSAGPSLSTFKADTLETLDDDMKLQLLNDVFDKYISRYSIQYTYRKCNGNWNRAMEELLNHVNISDTANNHDGGIFSAKGIEGFSEDGNIQRGRKGKAKHKRSRNADKKRSSSLPGLHDQSPTRVANKWQTATEDVEFVASRTGITHGTVSSIYYESGASLPKTIAALLRASADESQYVVTDGVSVSSQARDLGREFPTISLEHLTVLIRLTHPSMTAARDLANALTSKPTEFNGGLQIVPQYVRLKDIDMESIWTTASREAKSAGPSRSPSSDGQSVLMRRDNYNLARAAAFAQANAARRKAKSDHLMGGAAAYYSEVGREYSALSSNASAQAADQLAASQSTSTQLDLHGIDVRNAVRIAQEKVEEWWDSLGERRVNGRLGAEERQAGYRIVVGLGRHSAGGHNKLGPAVTKRLREEGWKVEPITGALLVSGPSKR